MRGRILIVDDDVEVRQVVGDALIEHGFVVNEAADAEKALSVYSSFPPDLVIVDVGLPGMNGVELLRELRMGRSIPVIMLTGRSHTADRVLALELGADDYVVKPFSDRELVARVTAVLRRGRGPASVTLEFDGLRIDRDSRDVWVDGELVSLTAREFDLLAFLAESPRRVYSREQLLAHVWESSPEWQDPSTVAEHVHRLRAKIEPDPGRPRRIQTLRGAGYRFVP